MKGPGEMTNGKLCDTAGTITEEQNGKYARIPVAPNKRAVKTHLQWTAKKNANESKSLCGISEQKAE